MNEKRRKRPPQGPQLRPIRKKKPEKEKEPAQSKFTLILLSVCLFVALFTLVMKQLNQEVERTADNEITGGLTVGTVAPPFNPSGWTNGNAPDLKDLNGKVYVLHAWGLGCVYCKKFAPELVEAYNMYHDQGVEFIGMTADTRLDNDKIDRTLKEMKITWPNGTGAAQFMRDYDVNNIPAAWVVDRTGKIVWNFDSEEPLEKGIANALASISN